MESVESPDTKHCHCHCVESGPSSASAAATAATVPSAPLTAGKDATGSANTQCEHLEESPVVAVLAPAVDHAELAMVPVEPEVSEPGSVSRRLRSKSGAGDHNPS